MISSVKIHVYKWIIEDKFYNNMFHLICIYNYNLLGFLIIYFPAFLISFCVAVLMLTNFCNRQIAL